MTDANLAAEWGELFGLARSPMFEREPDQADGQHDVLLDGGHGSFGLSVVEDLRSPEEAAGWAWSSDLPHHVSVTKREVQVVRWDSARDAQLYSRESVSRDLEGFYQYLCRDRLRSNRSVVQHLITLFGRVRSLVAYAKLPDERAIDAFVTVLADLIEGNDRSAQPVDYGLPDDAADLRHQLASPALDEALRDIRNAPATLSALTLHPSLAIRHAGGQLFQEAHFDLVRAPAPDLFDFVEEATATRASRGGTHFTPPALARSIVDFTLAQIPDLDCRPTLVLSDPACGSAAFLHEALRGLRRVKFDGAIKIVGRDISPAAIAMARLTLKLALRDWTPGGGATLDIALGDSLAEPAFPNADVTLMNPPFISVIAQTPEQKVQLRSIVGETAGSRGDFSMAFVTRAAAALNEGGAMGTLFPANLLTHDAATQWRENLAAYNDVRLLASIGDFGLFSQAMVHVACLVLTKGQAGPPGFTALVTGNDPGATGEALRGLRKAHGVLPKTPTMERQWSLFAAEASVLDRKQTWRILTPSQRHVIAALEAAQTPTVGSLFDIAQGVQTGNLKIFLFTDEQFRQLRLPTGEQRFFRKALMTDSIDNGRVIKVYRLFYPYDRNGALFSKEEEVAAALPTFYKRVLKPNEDALAKRVGITRAKRSDWWGLNYSRQGSFAFSDQPRIVSKFFGAEGSFALDEHGQLLPSTGHVWTPKHADQYLLKGEEEDVAAAALLDVLSAYVTLLNSHAFMRLVSLRSVTIAGGQFDLSSRFLAPVHLPDLWEKARDPRYAGHVRAMANVGRDTQKKVLLSSNEIDRLVALLYGVPDLAEG